MFNSSDDGDAKQRKLGLEELLVGGVAAEGITRGRRALIHPLVVKGHSRLPTEAVDEALAKNISRKYVPNLDVQLGPPGTVPRMVASEPTRVAHFPRTGNIPTLFHEVGHGRQGRAAFSKLFGNRAANISVRLSPLLAAQAAMTDDSTEKALVAGGALLAGIPSAARLGREVDAWGRGWAPYEEYQRAAKGVSGRVPLRPYLRAASRALPGYALSSPLATISLGYGAGKLWGKVRKSVEETRQAQTEKTSERRPSLLR